MINYVFHRSALSALLVHIDTRPLWVGVGNIMSTKALFTGCLSRHARQAFRQQTQHRKDMLASSLEEKRQHPKPILPSHGPTRVISEYTTSPVTGNWATILPYGSQRSEFIHILHLLHPYSLFILQPGCSPRKFSHQVGPYWRLRLLLLKLGGQICHRWLTRTHALRQRPQNIQGK